MAQPFSDSLFWLSSPVKKNHTQGDDVSDQRHWT